MIASEYKAYYCHGDATTYLQRSIGCQSNRPQLLLVPFDPWSDLISLLCKLQPKSLVSFRLLRNISFRSKLLFAIRRNGFCSSSPRNTFLTTKFPLQKFSTLSKTVSKTRSSEKYRPFKEKKWKSHFWNLVKDTFLSFLLIFKQLVSLWYQSFDLTPCKHDFLSKRKTKIIDFYSIPKLVQRHTQGNTVITRLSAAAFIKFFVIRGRRLFEGSICSKSKQ